MKNKWIAYLCLGFAISFLIIYVTLDLINSKETVVRQVEIKDDITYYDDKDLIVTLPDKVQENDFLDLESFEASFTAEVINDELFNKMIDISFHSRGYINREDLSLLSISYYDFNGQSQNGSMIVHNLVAEEVLEIFEILYENKYYIDKIRLVHEYDGDDDLSMSDNNTHSFNDRMIGGTNRISNHAFGLAIDINPIQNPYVLNGLILPENSKTFLERDYYQQGMILKNDVCYNAFIDRGWTWGGNWDKLKDFQHFEKKIPNIND